MASKPLIPGDLSPYSQTVKMNVIIIWWFTCCTMLVNLLRVCCWFSIAEAVSRWLPTTADLGSRPGLASGTCGGQSGVEAGFLKVLWFPLPKLFISPTHNHSGQTSRGLATSWSPVQGVLLTVLDLVTEMKRKSFMEAAKAQNWAVEPQVEKKNVIGSASHLHIFFSYF
jgi:hypothetical protein